VSTFLRTTATLLAIFLLALAPRILAPGDFWTADEGPHWAERVQRFSQAIEQGDYAGTLLTGHPGVTTMWLGTAGTWMRQASGEWGWIDPDEPFNKRLFLRIPIALATALCIALSYPLLRRLFGPPVALLTTFLWATNPFLIAHSKVLHLDALLTSFIVLSLLTALVGFCLENHLESRLKSRLESNSDSQHPAPNIRWPMLIASAVTCGLALLTKSPSLILIPMTGLIVLTSIVMAQPAGGNSGGGYTHRLLLSHTIALVVWGITAAITWVALFPAAWVGPSRAVHVVVDEIVRNGAEPHEAGNFFMGKITDDPGPLFYPVAIVLRLTPWSMIGLLAAGGVALFHLAAIIRRSSSTTRLSPAPALALLLLFALLFIATLSILAKKFDRYALPAFPILDLVAAYGLLQAGSILHRRLFATVHPRGFAAAAGGTLLVVTVFTLLWYHPYELAYYNPLPGGGRVAQRSIVVGWGEGLAKAASYINQQEHACQRRVASWYKDAIKPYVCGETVHMSRLVLPDQSGYRADYLVLYINQLQRNREPESIALAHTYGSRIHTVRLHGIEYAHVYQLRQPLQHDLAAAGEAAQFGSSIQLVGYSIDSSDLSSTGSLTLTLQWLTLARISTDYTLFIHLFDGQGNRIGQADVPPAGPSRPTSTWQPGHYLVWNHPVLLQADIAQNTPDTPDTPDAPDTIWVALGLYDPHDFARLPLHAPDPPARVPGGGESGLFLQPVPFQQHQ
jgi:4-amino-4-deoxy-L-arabinose transferase-like glycosyltransferase